MRKILIYLLLSGIVYQNCFAQNLLAKSETKEHTGLSSEQYKTMTEDGAWCWFSDPRSIYYKGQRECTYTGWIDSKGDIFISSYNHQTKKTQSEKIYEKFQRDDHDNPSIFIDSQGYLLVFFSKHGASDPIHLVKSRNAEDISEWKPERILALNDVETYPDWRNSYTYYSPIQLSDEDNKLYLFWRGMDGKPSYSTSSDKGKSWSTGRIFFMPERTYGFRRPYTKYYSKGKDKIHILLTDGHPRNEEQNSVYYLCYKNGNFYKADGTLIKSISDNPINPQEADKLYDAKIGNKKAWIWDIAENEQGNPVVAYTTFPDDENHLYCYATWTGKQWESETLINSGKWFPKTPAGKTEKEPNYSGGMSIDKENPETIYLSIQRDGIFEIEKWTKKKSKWIIEPITKGSHKDNVRPFAVRDAEKKNPLQVLWMEVDHYVHYAPERNYSSQHYKTAIKSNLQRQQ